MNKMCELANFNRIGIPRFLWETSSTFRQISRTCCYTSWLHACVVVFTVLDRHKTCRSSVLIIVVTRYIVEVVMRAQLPWITRTTRVWLHGADFEDVFDVVSKLFCFPSTVRELQSIIGYCICRRVNSRFASYIVRQSPFVWRPLVSIIHIADCYNHCVIVSTIHCCHRVRGVLTWEKKKRKERKNSDCEQWQHHLHNYTWVCEENVL